MKIVLLGRDGQVGWALQRALQPLGEVIAFSRSEADLEDTASLTVRLRQIGPDVIVNAAAYTAVDKAESDQTRAHSINAVAPAALAAVAAGIGAWLIHYSTDYVFDGTKSGAYSEGDSTNPLSVYGATKQVGEAAILDSGCSCLIFRTSWVYAARGANFAKTMLRLAGERDRLSVVSDQFGAPTSADLIADVTALCLYRLFRIEIPEMRQGFAGIYHLVAGGETSWFEYARFLFAEARSNGLQLQISDENVLPIPASDYPTPARRPSNSRLSTEKLQLRFGLELPHWQEHVRRLVVELTSK